VVSTQSTTRYSNAIFFFFFFFDGTRSSYCARGGIGGSWLKIVESIIERTQ
jgi:hypothetical protein